MAPPPVELIKEAQNQAFDNHLGCRTEPSCDLWEEVIQRMYGLLSRKQRNRLAREVIPQA